MIVTAGADIRRFEGNFGANDSFLCQKIECEYLAAKGGSLANFYRYDNLNLMLSGVNLSCGGTILPRQADSLVSFCRFMGVYLLECEGDYIPGFPYQTVSLMEYGGRRCRRQPGIVQDENIYAFASFCTGNFDRVSFDLLYSSFARKINRGLGHLYCVTDGGHIVSGAYACEFGEGVYITFVSTAPAFRGRGLAAGVIRHIIHRAGGRKVWLMCEDSLAGYYRGLGFEKKKNIYLYKMRNDSI